MGLVRDRTGDLAHQSETAWGDFTPPPRLGGGAVACQWGLGSDSGHPHLCDLGIISAETAKTGTWVFTREGGSVALLA